MKLPIIFVLTFFFVIINSDGGHSPSWLPNFIGTFQNRTIQLSNFVREKSQALKNLYVNNVRNKIHHYFGMENRTKRMDNDVLPIEYNDPEIKKKQVNLKQRIKRKFVDYLNQAETTESQLFDVIAPATADKVCLEDDPAVRMPTPSLIAYNGYPAESHTIITDDGYILTVHRIPFSKNSTTKVAPKKTVLLHHGLLGSSADWVIPGPEKGLAYILSQAGYDVWLANVRGNTYSRAHVTLDIESFSFWNFTFHEVSQYDLPAVIDYIMERKSWDVKIDYIGHSMGTTVLFALLSTKTEYNKVLRAGYALAPVAFMSEIKSPIRLLARFSNNIEYLMKLLGANQFLPQNSVLRWLAKHACEINRYEEAICENSLFVLCGHDAKQFNKTLLPLILGHVPAGASTKTLIHYSQEIQNNGRFQQFDYGSEGNFIQYGTETPPEYPVHRITLPIALFSAENDWLASDVDVTNLYVQLVNPIEHYLVPYKEFNHIDFLWAVDAKKFVYDKLLKLLKEGDSAPIPTALNDLKSVINI